MILMSSLSIVLFFPFLLFLYSLYIGDFILCVISVSFIIAIMFVDLVMVFNKYGELGQNDITQSSRLRPLPPELNHYTVSNRNTRSTPTRTRSTQAKKKKRTKKKKDGVEPITKINNSRTKKAKQIMMVGTKQRKKVNNNAKTKK